MFYCKCIYFELGSNVTSTPAKSSCSSVELPPTPLSPVLLFKPSTLEPSSSHNGNDMDIDTNVSIEYENVNDEGRSWSFDLICVNIWSLYTEFIS